jgi:small subunit ribosomal protein S6
MLFIVHPNYEQDRLEAVTTSVQKEITDNGGKILKIDDWGKRKLAYLINKQRYGSYILMYFEIDPSKVQGIHEWMEIQAPVLHQMIIRLEDKPELSDESENPDSTAGSTIIKKVVPVKEAPAAPVKKAVEDVVEEVVEKVVEAPSAEALEEKEVVEEVSVEETVVEEVAVEEEDVTEETTEEKGE